MKGNITFFSTYTNMLYKWKFKKKIKTMSVFRFEYLVNFWFVIFPCRQTHGAHEPTRPNKIAPKGLMCSLKLH